MGEPGLAPHATGDRPARPIANQSEMTVNAIHSPPRREPDPRLPAPPSAPPGGRAIGLRRAALFIVVTASAALLAWKLGVFELRDRDKLVAAITAARQLRFLIPVFVVAYAAAVTFALPAASISLWVTIPSKTK